MEDYTKLAATLTALVRELVPVVLAEAIRDGQVQVVRFPGERLALTVKEVSETLGVPAGTLAEWRKKKRGPAWSKPGKTVLYPRAGVEEYLRAITVAPRQGVIPAAASRR